MYLAINVHLISSNLAPVICETNISPGNKNSHGNYLYDQRLGLLDQTAVKVSRIDRLKQSGLTDFFEAAMLLLIALPNYSYRRPKRPLS